MLNLMVYNSDAEKAQLLNGKCESYINRNSRKIETGGWYSEAADFSDAAEKLWDSALFMVKKKECPDAVSETLISRGNSDYTVFVLESADEILDAVSPALRPSGLILESFDEDRIGRTVDEIYADYIRVTEHKGGPSYHFRIKGVDYTESFRNIYKIEVQNKRVTFHTESQSYEFYDSLDSVMKAAPDCFIRIQRSILVNLEYVRDLNQPDNEVIFYNDQREYYSRNFASDLKGSFYRFSRENKTS